MKLLVTGGAGFIGTNFLIYMLDKYPDYEFVCVDNLSVAESTENLKYLQGYSKLKIYNNDITDEKFIDELFKKEKFDMVVNFAAESFVDSSIKNPNVCIKTNVLGTAILMNACLKYGVRRFHQISTDEVYGDLPLKTHKKYDEKEILKPSNPYAASKAGADMLVLAYYRTYKLNVTISRTTNNYGPFQSFRNLIPRTIINSYNNNKIPVCGDGSYVRDWIYVLDNVKAIDLVMHKGQPGQIYNISSDEKTSNIKVVKTILKLMNKKKELIDFVENRPGQDIEYSINSNKLKKELGWKKEYTFNEGIKETIAWYQDYFKKER